MAQHPATPRVDSERFGYLGRIGAHFSPSGKSSKGAAQAKEWSWTRTLAMGLKMGFVIVCLTIFAIDWIASAKKQRAALGVSTSDQQKLAELSGLALFDPLTTGSSTLHPCGPDPFQSGKERQANAPHTVVSSVPLPPIRP
jgi:hypothetical protein